MVLLSSLSSPYQVKLIIHLSKSSSNLLEPMPIGWPMGCSLMMGVIKEPSLQVDIFRVKHFGYSVVPGPVVHCGDSPV